MTRGRKKDQTIPPTRALILQRDYRTRRAQYVADLEKRCQAAEEGNHRLRQEIKQAQAVKLSSVYTWSPQTAGASSVLLSHLNATSLALVHFHELMCQDIKEQQDYAPITAAPSSSLVTSVAHHPAHNSRPQSKVMPNDLGSVSDTVANETISLTGDMVPSHGFDGHDLNLELNCCGGWMSCQDSGHAGDGIGQQA